MIVAATYIISLVILIAGFVVATVILKKQNTNWMNLVKYEVNMHDMTDIFMYALAFILFASIGLIPAVNIICAIVVFVLLSCYAYKGESK